MATSTETLGFHHVAVAASNFDRSKSFYDMVMGLLGLTPAIQATGYPHKETDGHLCTLRRQDGHVLAVGGCQGGPQR